MKKRIISILGTVVLSAALLAGCTNTPTQPVSEFPSVEDLSPVITSEIVSDEEPADDTPVAGGWEVYTADQTRLTEEEDETFNTAVSKNPKLEFEPVKVLATQLVAGTNTAYLVFGQYANSPDMQGYGIAIVYTDLEGNSTVTSLTMIDPADLQISNPDGNALGTWEVVTSGKPGMFPSEAAQASFDEAVNGDEVQQNPVALLYEQVVAGTNYVALSTGSDGNLYLTKWYCDLDGKGTMIENGVIYWDAYTENEV